MSRTRTIFTIICIALLIVDALAGNPVPIKNYKNKKSTKVISGGYSGLQAQKHKEGAIMGNKKILAKNKAKNKNKGVSVIGSRVGVEEVAYGGGGGGSGRSSRRRSYSSTSSGTVVIETSGLDITTGSINVYGTLSWRTTYSALIHSGSSEARCKFYDCRHSWCRTLFAFTQSCSSLMILTSGPRSYGGSGSGSY
jgi:hypothetical protein